MLGEHVDSRLAGDAQTKGTVSCRTQTKGTVSCRMSCRGSVLSW